MSETITHDLEEIDAIPFIELDSAHQYKPPNEPGITKYKVALGKSAPLESMLVNQCSDILLVSCHGALDRKTISLPRFERLRSFLQTPHSSLYFADPTLHLGDRLTLGWFTGWKELDLYPILADWVKTTAEAIGARKIIFVGSSGGGFASLQISSYLPGSLAIPLNPQTTIQKYSVKGTLSHQRNYLQYAMPHLIPDEGIRKLRRDRDWSAPLGERASLLLRYEHPKSNYILYAQNVNDTHHFKDHYEPFRKIIENGPNRDRVRFFTYEGPDKHQGPRWKQIREHIDDSI